jgi:hypothetical protein
MNSFFITIGSGMPHGSGYWEIQAETEDQARELAFKHCPDGRWSFLYHRLEDVHKLDRTKHGTITENGIL